MIFLRLFLNSEARKSPLTVKLWFGGIPAACRSRLDHISGRTPYLAKSNSRCRHLGFIRNITPVPWACTWLTSPCIVRGFEATNCGDTYHKGLALDGVLLILNMDILREQLRVETGLLVTANNFQSFLLKKWTLHPKKNRIGSIEVIINWEVHLPPFVILRLYYILEETYLKAEIQNCELLSEISFLFDIIAHNFNTLIPMILYYLFNYFIEALQNTVAKKITSSSDKKCTNVLSQVYREVVVARSQVMWILWIFNQYVLHFIQSKHRQNTFMGRCIIW